MHSVAIMNDRRFGNAFIPSSSSSSSSSSPSYRGKSSLLLPRYSFFRATACIRMRGLHQACLSPLEGKMTSRPFLTGQREEMLQPHTPVRFLVLPSCSRAGHHCRVDLRGLREFPFKETKKKRKRLSFLSSSPASLDLSDLPRFLMPIPGSYLSSLSHFVARRGH